MDPLLGYDAWLTNEPCLYEPYDEDGDEEQARYDEWVDSEIDAVRERESERDP